MRPGSTRIGWRAKCGAPPSRRAARTARSGRNGRQKDQVKRIVEASIKANAGPRDTENLLRDLYERLEDPDIEAELGSRPIGEIVAGICRDLGITADPSRNAGAGLGFGLGRAGEPDGDAGLAKLPTGFIGTPGCPSHFFDPAPPPGAPPGAPPRVDRRHDPPCRRCK